MKNNIYVRAWLGELSLPIAFWIVQFLTTAVLMIIAAMIVNENHIIAIMAPYTIYALICVIRCARKYRKESKSKLKIFNSIIALLWSGLCVFFTLFDLIAVIIG